MEGDKGMITVNIPNAFIEYGVIIFAILAILFILWLGIKSRGNERFMMFLAAGFETIALLVYCNTIFRWIAVTVL
jgi:hypothetical protein